MTDKNWKIFMPITIPPLCRVCAHLMTPEIPTCNAFPGGIPAKFLAGERHIDTVPVDHGIAFRKKTEAPSWFIAGTAPETLFRVTCTGSYERYVPILDLWELDNEFIRYILAIPLAYRPVTGQEADAFIEKTRECLEAMNPCMRENRQKMYLSTRKSDFP
ncbi:MAG: hypothetical protein ABFC24_11070 [Methanoregulaceae archaeon]